VSCLHQEKCALKLTEPSLTTNFDGLKNALIIIDFNENLSINWNDTSNINDDWLLWKTNFMTIVKGFIPTKPSEGQKYATLDRLYHYPYPQNKGNC
jgi:hypothetical protein